MRNVLETKFGLDPRTHDEFLDVFKKNCRYVAIGAEWTPGQQVLTVAPTATLTLAVNEAGATTPAAPAGSA